MPVTLVELVFITNSQETDILRNKQVDLTVTVTKRILSYLKIPYKGKGDDNLNKDEFSSWQKKCGIG